MDESAWWPKGVIHDDLLTNESESILTEFGTMNLWNFESSLSMEWWEKKPEDGVIWGEWPDVTEVKIQNYSMTITDFKFIFWCGFLPLFFLFCASIFDP